jgi:hypothetical protein
MTGTDKTTKFWQMNITEKENSGHLNIINKGKAIPLQAWTGPKGSRRLRFPDFKTIGK